MNAASGKRIALVLGPGNLAVDYAQALVRGPERALLELGFDVQTFNTAHYKESIQAFYRRRPRVGPRVGIDQFPEGEGLVRGLLDFFGADRFDLTIGLFYDAYLTPALMGVLRERGGRLVNWPLNLLDQENHFRRCLAFFDETWCAEEGALEGLRAQHGARIRFVPMASDPHIFRPLGSPKEPAVLFLGSAYGERVQMLARCGEILPTTVAGPGHGPVSVLRTIARRALRERHFIGPREGAQLLLRSVRGRAQPVGDEEYVRLAAAHGVSVGFSDVKQETTGKTVHKVRLREYDAAMTGLCHLARRLPELERHFEPGKEMLLYDSTDELFELLREIARGQIDFRAVGAAARKRAVRDHTWTTRLRAALSALGGTADQKCE